MAQDPSSPSASTRWIETSRGIFSYSELAPLLAERVLRVQEEIESGSYGNEALDDRLICKLHYDFCGDLVPEWAGKWRNIAVQVGMHHPSPPHLVPLQMREYVLDLEVRLRSATLPEQWPDLLAFAEGRLLSIHPFADFNGRLTRLWLWEVMRRLRLPPVRLVSADPLLLEKYLDCLRHADHLNYAPLENFWKDRLANAGDTAW